MSTLSRQVDADRVLRTVLWSLVIVALMAGIPGLVARLAYERASHTVELVMDLDQVQLLAQSQGLTTSEILAELAWAGLEAVTWSEASLDKLSRSGEVVVLEGREVNDRLAAGFLGADVVAQGGVPTPGITALARRGFFQAGYTYAWTSDLETGRWLEEAATVHLEPGRWRVERVGSETVLEVTLLKERAVFLNLGFYPPELERSGAAELGLRVVPRPAALAGSLDPAQATAAVEAKAALVADTLSALGIEPSAMIFAGGTIPGYPQAPEAAAALVRTLRVPPALIETPGQLGNISQSGLVALVEDLGYEALRVYSLPSVRVWAPSSLADKAARSVKERGLRLVYLQPYLAVPEQLLGTAALRSDGTSLYARPPERDATTGADPYYPPMLALNVNYVRELADLLTAQGFRLGRPEVPAVPAPMASGWVALMALGPSAGLALAWLDLRPDRRRWRVLGLAGAAAVAVGLAGLALAGSTVPAQQVTALLAALVFPSLGLAWLARTWVTARQRPHGVALALAARDLVVTSGYALLGGLFVSAVLSDIRFMLELELFRGVKLTYLVPPVAGVVYWMRYRYPVESRPSAWPGLIRSLLNESIRIWHGVAAGGLGAALLYYVGRSGNTTVLPIGSLELTFNRWLERLVYARPRLKEMFIGHPALVAGAWLAHSGRRNFQGWFLFAAGIGQVSLVNSFEHIRSPLLLSLARSLNGLWLGLVIGLAMAALLAVVLRHTPTIMAWWRSADRQTGEAEVPR